MAHHAPARRDGDGGYVSLVRELVQPYNWTRHDAHISFLTPTAEEVRDSLGPAGYVPVRLRHPLGTVANLTQLVVYTEDCPRFGMFGRGLSCRTCPAGGY